MHRPDTGPPPMPPMGPPPMPPMGNRDPAFGEVVGGGASNGWASGFGEGVPSAAWEAAATAESPSLHWIPLLLALPLAAGPEDDDVNACSAFRLSCMYAWPCGEGGGVHIPLVFSPHDHVRLKLGLRSDFMSLLWQTTATKEVRPPPLP